MEQYLYVSFKNGFCGWYRDPDELAGLGDLVYAPLGIYPHEIGEVILVQRMSAGEARFFYPARIKLIESVYDTFEHRPEDEKAEGLARYQKIRKLFERNPAAFAFRA